MSRVFQYIDLPLRPAGVSPPPATKAWGTHSPGEKGGGGQYFERRET
jgi:hypothetical protein